MIRTIPRDQWREELDSFSRQHEGWIVRVDIADPDGRVRTEARDLPLQGVSLDTPSTSRVDIIVGKGTDDHVTHIEQAVDVALETTDEGAERGLCIRASDGSTTTVAFRSPMRAEDVDGMPVR